MRAIGLLAWLGLACAGAIAARASVEADDPGALLTRADAIKSARNADFQHLLATLTAERAQLSAPQQRQLDYLQAWQMAYTGDYARAVPILDRIMDHDPDPTLRVRAGSTVVNILAISGHNDEAYARLDRLLEAMQATTDPVARDRSLGVAALLYSRAGQYDLALSFANRLIDHGATPLSVCEGWQLKLHAAVQAPKPQLQDGEFQRGIDACTRADEPVWTNLIRTDQAAQWLKQGRPAATIALLRRHDTDIHRPNYRPLSLYADATLATAYWQTGNATAARAAAQRAVDEAVQQAVSEPLVAAYRVLFQVAQAQGDDRAALAWHEKLHAADKGYLNDVSARALAYQMVHQQVMARKAELDRLSQQNQMLNLQQAVQQKSALTVRLGVALLLVLLGSIGLYAIRTRRSQLKFRQLARRDGLTGICNHQYFVESASQQLDYDRKGMRESSLIAIDLDHFKQINDRHGHAAGDRALKGAVAACRQHLRSHDVFGRTGGEEFAILLPDCAKEQAQRMAEAMRKAIASLHGADDGLEFPLTASFGVTSTSASGYELQLLMAHADAALYESKRQGRDRVTVHAGEAQVGEPA